MKCKPKDSNNLKAFDSILKEIHRLIISKETFTDNNIEVVIEYFRLLHTMMEPEQNYLFSRQEITISSANLAAIATAISKNSLPSQQFIKNYLYTIRCSLNIPLFLNNYDDFITSIYTLAMTSQNLTDSTVWNFKAAQQMLSITGELEKLLKYWDKQPYFTYNLAQTLSHTELLRKNLYQLFSFSLGDNLVKWFVFEKYLKESYKNNPSANLQAICANLQECQANYTRFVDEYICSPGIISNFTIKIKHNAVSENLLRKTCDSMRQMEKAYLYWLEGIGFTISNLSINAAEYQLHLALSKKDYLIDSAIIEASDKSNTRGFYRVKKMENNRLLGHAYTYKFDDTTGTVSHEYLHHLFAALMENNRLKYYDYYKIYNEGNAEWFSGGICSPKFNKTVRNTTQLLQNLRTGNYQMDFSFIWVAYLGNHQLRFYRDIIEFFQRKEKNKLDLATKKFFNSSSQTQEFLDWVSLRENLCQSYNALHPKWPSKPLLFLDDIIKQLNTNYSTTASSLHPNIATASAELTRSTMSKTTIELSIPARITSQLAQPITIESTTNLTMTSSFFSSGTTESLKETTTPFHPSSMTPVTTLLRKKILSALEPSIPLPLVSLGSGLLSGLIDNGSNRLKKHPCLVKFITYGIKPSLLSPVAAGLDQLLLGPSLFFDQALLNFSFYLSGNYIGIIAAQFLNRKIDKKIPNKPIAFAVQVLMMLCLWNPSLLMSEQLLWNIFLLLVIQLANGFLFSLGEWGIKHVLDSTNLLTEPHNNSVPLSHGITMSSELTKILAKQKEKLEGNTDSKKSLPIANQNKIKLATKGRHRFYKQTCTVPKGVKKEVLESTNLLA